MWFALLVSLVLAVQSAQPTGIISGRVSPPENLRITKPIQVVLLAGPYAEIYSTDLQKRIDTFWEDYRQAFIQDKEAFLLFRERAKSQALEFTLNRMRANDPLKFTSRVVNATNNTFEFHAVPKGECKIVALVTSGGQEFVWSETLILTDEPPPAVMLKPSLP